MSLRDDINLARRFVPELEQVGGSAGEAAQRLFEEIYPVAGNASMREIDILHGFSAVKELISGALARHVENGVVPSHLRVHLDNNQLLGRWKELSRSFYKLPATATTEDIVAARLSKAGHQLEEQILKYGGTERDFDAALQQFSDTKLRSGFKLSPQASIADLHAAVRTNPSLRVGDIPNSPIAPLLSETLARADSTFESDFQKLDAGASTETLKRLHSRTEWDQISKASNDLRTQAVRNRYQELLDSPTPPPAIVPKLREALSAEQLSMLKRQTSAEYFGLAKTASEDEIHIARQKAAQEILRKELLPNGGTEEEFQAALQEHCDERLKQAYWIQTDASTVELRRAIHNPDSESKIKDYGLEKACGWSPTCLPEDAARYSRRAWDWVNNLTGRETAYEIKAAQRYLEMQQTNGLVGDYRTKAVLQRLNQLENLPAPTHVS